MSLFSSLLNLSRHADQSSEMMGVVGVDLSSVPDDQKGQVFRRVAMRCSQCEEPEDCKDWMATHPTADAPPSYCRNADLFARLMGEIDKPKA